MSNVTEKDLLLALLSLDAYHQASVGWASAHVLNNITT